MLQPPKIGRPLILYMALEEEAIGAMVAQADEAGVEHEIYYLSKKLLPYEIKYDIVQKTCLAVIWATRKLRYYFQSYQVEVVAKVDFLWHLYEAHVLIRKLAKWLVLLTEFDIKYTTKKTIKGRAMAEFLALTPRE